MNSLIGSFNKLEIQAEGTGIGLSLVKRIIATHKEGKYIAFYFSLPALQTKE